MTVDERTRRYSANAAKRRLASSQPALPAVAQPQEPAGTQPLPPAGIYRRPSRAVIVASIAIFVSCAVLLALLIRNADYWAPVQAHKPAPTGSVKAPVKPAVAGEPDFEASYERLGAALSAFPGANMADVMEAARQVAPKAAAGCAVQWQGGEAALQYGKSNDPSALAVAVGHCADAVEALRTHLADAQAKRRETGY